MEPKSRFGWLSKERRKRLDTLIALGYAAERIRRKEMPKDKSKCRDCQRNPIEYLTITRGEFSSEKNGARQHGLRSETRCGFQNQTSEFRRW
jgi:hypothetical protein